jgi:type I restriction enzyme R subunit
MNPIGSPEAVTQQRIIQLFRDEMNYRYLGDWTYRANSNIEEDLVKNYLIRNKYSDPQINRAIHQLHVAADDSHRSLYLNNKAVYGLLRYGVPVKEEAGRVTETVHLINWAKPEKNDFAIAEEVTLKGHYERRPDLVLYINGIAIGAIELKRSSVSIGDGIRQSISNQSREFNEWFYSTIQFVFAGNDSEGMRYGTIGTEEKYFLNWKEDEEDDSRFKLDKYLLKICNKERLLDLIHDFVVFDGVKKLARVHQYFGIKAAQGYVIQHKGGIIWHSQGSGKSIIMVLLAKWILENNPNARVVIITDRDELDKQIKDVFTDVGERIYRTSSGADLMRKLSQATPRLLCSLIHKFGVRNEPDFEAFIRELQAQPSHTIGEVFVFVDECHRTQSNKLHRAMKTYMPNAVFIGFTGTPLLKKDAQTSLEVFGGYIHTYKFDEAVQDGVVLDLVYEARDIDQSLESQEAVDAWFDMRTESLNNWQKDELKKKWGTMQVVLSSRSRMERVVQDIVVDFVMKPRLKSARGNAMLVASSIYEACKYFMLFQSTAFRGKCAIVTSYDPQIGNITLEDIGANTDTDKEFVYKTYNELLKDVQIQAGKSKTEVYEDTAKERFIKEPASMRLLIVVDKLLTGFDAPPCTFLYIDKFMQDHGLFQAICRTNRLDGDDKDFGYIVDYKNLFIHLEKAIAVYTSELDQSSGGADSEVLMKDRLSICKDKLDKALETLDYLCEPVQLPQTDLEYIHYFCGNTEIETDLEEHESQRVMLYKSIATLVRAYGNIVDELEPAGYDRSQIETINWKLREYVRLREIVRMASGESLDFKAYEADMRFLIDSYIRAELPRRITAFEDLPLIQLLVESGIANDIAEKLSAVPDNKEAVAEVIENNVRSKIIREALNDPVYFERMSELLNEIIELRRTKAIEYKEYLLRIVELSRQVHSGQNNSTPARLDTPGKRALYNNLNENEELALQLNEAILHERPDDWRGNEPRERVIKAAMYKVLKDESEVERIFLIIKAQREY